MKARSRNPRILEKKMTTLPNNVSGTVVSKDEKFLRVRLSAAIELAGGVLTDTLLIPREDGPKEPVIFEQLEVSFEVVV